MSHLVLCLSCQRHVRVSDERCPFCAVGLSAEQRASAEPVLPRRRLGRAALFTFGATLIGGAACGDGSGGAKDAGHDAATDSGTGGGSGGAATGGAAGGGAATGGVAGGSGG